MNILLIGSGGREHAIAEKLSESKRLNALFIAPGNPGTAQCGKNIAISEYDHEGLIAFAKEKNISLVIIGPEAPLARGLADQFDRHKIPCMGPGQLGAQLESSKQWAKSFMKRWAIPTAPYESFSDIQKAKNYVLQRNQFPIVIKADGLAAGKGVVIVYSLEEAESTLNKMMVEFAFSEAGKQVVIEDFLEGEEASILAFTDGETILPMASAQDHKAIFNGDKGPNTGGMGAYSPAPIVTPTLEEEVYNTVFKPFLKGMQSEGITYQGILYAGLMISQGKPYVIEFNCRFGDPETQVVLPRLENDLIDIFEAVTQRRLKEHLLRWKPESAVCVVLASRGYPGDYAKGYKILGVDTLDSHAEATVIHAGTRREEGTLVTNGGRVLGVVGMDNSLQHAIEKTYNTVQKVYFDGVYFRNDIAAKALP